MVTADPWAALDCLDREDPDLVLCSVTLRVGDQPLYRLLWDAQPEIKARFMLIAPPNTAARPTAALVGRPITPDILQSALDRFERQ